MLLVFWIALVFGFYMAWSIGANDAANAMGTSVGSRAVTFKEAVIIAAIFEFSGAFLAGAGVTDTMRKGIVDPMAFNAMPHGGELFVLGMLAALISAALWIHIAAFLGWPVSTTHSIVGAITGFGIVELGVAQIKWAKLGFIVASWVVSPLVGGVISFLLFMAIRKLILEAEDPLKAARQRAPAFAFPVFVVLALVLFMKGLKNFQNKAGLFEFKSLGLTIGMTEVFVIAGVTGALASVALGLFTSRLVEGGPAETTGRLDGEGEDEIQYGYVERVFRYLQVITACFVAFAHGSNDVANSIGPLAAIVGMFKVEGVTNIEFIGTIAAKVPVHTSILLLGALGIVIGLASYGWKVIETVGTKITEITPSRGFAAEFGAATTILVGSKLGLPLSTTHTIVGAVIGVGFARGMNALNLRIVLSIVQSWIYTIPFTAILSIILYIGFKAIFI